MPTPPAWRKASFDDIASALDTVDHPTLSGAHILQRVLDHLNKQAADERYLRAISLLHEVHYPHYGTGKRFTLEEAQALSRAYSTLMECICADLPAAEAEALLDTATW